VIKPTITIGCCGWGYLREKNFSAHITRKFRSKLQAYVQLFQSVEVNSTFYRIPKLVTAEKWRREADEMNKQFEFTVKASKIITHVDRFGSRASIDAFSQMLDICAALRAKVLLLQSPESFRPTPENINRLEKFFGAVKRGSFTIAWEPRGKWWEMKERVQQLCDQFKIVCCVDPFRNSPLLVAGRRLGYFRLHGFGKPSMYMYRFSGKEMEELLSKCIGLWKSLDRIYVFFNNAFMYENALEFGSLVSSYHH
jgi:uncharacterized protein YecE (DUF72 family)